MIKRTQKAENISSVNLFQLKHQKLYFKYQTND